MIGKIVSFNQLDCERSFRRTKDIVERNLHACPEVAKIALEFYQERWPNDTRIEAMRRQVDIAIANVDCLHDLLGVHEIPAHIEPSLQGIRAAAVALGFNQPNAPHLDQYHQY